ncbi:MAG: hypothetical protein Q9165_008002 [Trypethelium subeluteriae]
MLVLINLDVEAATPFQVGGPRSVVLEQRYATRPTQPASNNTYQWHQSRGVLTERAFDASPSPGDNSAWDQYMVNKFASSQNVIVNIPGKASPNNAWYRDLGTTQVNLALEGFSGCITLVVMSEQGVYMTHFWEDTSFPTQNAATPEPEEMVYGGFQGNVVDLMDQGRSDYPAGTNPQQIQESLRAHQASFMNQPGLTAYLFVGVIDDTTYWPNGGPQYPDSISQIQQQVTGYIGITPTIVEYNMPKDDTTFNDDNKATTALGKVVFQYDPSSGNSAGAQGYRLFIERTLQTEHYW